jgi:hypothetical protein
MRVRITGVKALWWSKDASELMLGSVIVVVVSKIVFHDIRCSVRMELRLPSVRAPQSLYDVYVVSVAGTIVMALVLHVWHGSFVRIEMGIFIGAVFLWAGWATYRVLGRYVEAEG